MIKSPRSYKRPFVHCHYKNLEDLGPSVTTPPFQYTNCVEMMERCCAVHFSGISICGGVVVPVKDGWTCYDLAIASIIEAFDSATHTWSGKSMVKEER